VVEGKAPAKLRKISAREHRETDVIRVAMARGIVTDPVRASSPGFRLR
jgi:hypothetical protein